MALSLHEGAARPLQRGLRDDLNPDVSATPDADQLRRRALGGRVHASHLNQAWNATGRSAVLTWLTRAFGSLGLQDSWLAASVSLLDRSAAAAAPKSAPSGERLGPWVLAATMLALKLSEAEAALSCDPGDVVLVMASGLPSAWRPSSRDVFRKALAAAEQWILVVLNYQVATPTSHELIDHFVVILTRSAADVLGEEDWAGFRRQSRLDGKSLPDGRLRFADIGQSMTKNEELACSCVERAASKYTQRVQTLTPKRNFGMVATYLVELALAHDPQIVYGTRSPLTIVALAALDLAISAFPWLPAECANIFHGELRHVLAMDEFSKFQMAREGLHALWAQPPGVSEVVQKWHARLPLLAEGSMVACSKVSPLPAFSKDGLSLLADCPTSDMKLHKKTDPVQFKVDERESMPAELEHKDIATEVSCATPAKRDGAKSTGAGDPVLVETPLTRTPSSAQDAESCVSSIGPSLKDVPSVPRDACSSPLRYCHTDKADVEMTADEPRSVQSASPAPGVEDSKSACPRAPTKSGTKERPKCNEASPPLTRKRRLTLTRKMVWTEPRKTRSGILSKAADRGEAGAPQPCNAETKRRRLSVVGAVRTSAECEPKESECNPRKKWQKLDVAEQAPAKSHTQLPSPLVLPKRSLALVEGGACQTDGIWRLGGLWRRGSGNKGEPSYSIEWEAKSASSEGTGPFSGLYMGHFWYHGKSWQRYDENKIELRFEANSGGGFNITGSGWNEFCIFSVEGVMESDGSFRLVKNAEDA